MIQPGPDTPTIPITPPTTPAGSQPARPHRTWLLVLLSCLLAALIPETIATASTSPARMLAQPLLLPFEAAFYGTAVLLVREALLRRIGLPALLLLGAAFGAFNEGVAAGTWYTVQPKGYAFLGPLDLTWAVALTLFHTFVSVILTVAFLDVAFPRIRGRSLLRRRGIAISAAVFLILSLLLALALAPSYRPYRLAVYALALALALLALALPPRAPRPTDPTPPPRLRTLRLAGFAAMLAYFALIYLVPQLTAALAGPHHALAAQLADVALFLLFAALLVRRGRAWTSRAGWTPRHTLALITGALAFPLLLMLLPFGWPLLEPLATLPFFLWLLHLDRRERRIIAALAPATSPAS